VGLGDITGVFSRYFVVGFFLPAYASLIALWFVASSKFIPNGLDHGHSQAKQLLILGGVALVAGLALSGLSYYITRIFEGYPLARLAGLPLLGYVHRAVVAPQRWHFDRLLAVRDDKTREGADRSRAAWYLEKWFPRERADLLPTRVGNAIRAFEQHSNTRWGLDGVTVWPRIEAMLTSDERELQIDAKINFYVFINGTIGAVFVGVCLVVDQAVYSTHSGWFWLWCVVSFLVAYLLSRAAIGPAIDWGDTVRSSIDLHRLDLYEKLGVRAPTSFRDERELAVKVNKALLYGRPLLGDELWRNTEKNAPSSSSGFLSRWFRQG